MEPLVSIIMPAHNSERYIEFSIYSVLNQIYENWELIIVDDCSTDSTQTIIKHFSRIDERVASIKLCKQYGAAIARNLATLLARGKYISFIDSDDLWTNDKLVKQISYMETNNYNFTYTKYKIIDEKGYYIGRKNDSIEAVDYSKLIKINYIGNSSAIYNCERIGKVYAPNIYKRNDYALWLKILKKEKLAYRVNEYLMNYRITQNSLSRNKIELIPYQWQLYRNIEGLSVIRSFNYVLLNCAKKVKDYVYGS